REARLKYSPRPMRRRNTQKRPILSHAEDLFNAASRRAEVTQPATPEKDDHHWRVDHHWEITRQTRVPPVTLGPESPEAPSTAPPSAASWSSSSPRTRQKDKPR